MTTANGEFQVIFMPSGRRGLAPSGQSLLDAARQMGVDIESICGGRLTCAKCRVCVEEGNFAKHGIRSSADHLSPAEAPERALLARAGDTGDPHAPAERLACAAHVTGDLLITVPEESRAHKQIIRKSATERTIDVDPAIRQVYVEVDRAELGEHRGDWGRVQAALAAGEAGIIAFMSNHGLAHAVVPATLAADVGGLFPLWLRVLKDHPGAGQVETPGA